MNNALDVVLSNTGTLAISIASFSFEISTIDTDVTFTDATTGTMIQTYVFNGDSFADNVFGSHLTPPGFLPGQTISGQDGPFLGTGTTLAAGASLGLGHILFGISPAATPGPFTVLFTGGTDFNNLTDTNFANIPIDQFNPATLTITATPEPGTLALFLGAAGLLVAGRWKRKPQV